MVGKKKTQINYESEYLKTNIDTNKIINRRLIILIGFVCFLMVVLVLRLYDLQVNSNQIYKEKLAIYNTTYQTITTPRGEIIDCNQQVIVANKQMLNITYFPTGDMTEADEWAIAYNFANDYEVLIDTINDRDKKDLFISTQSSGFKSFVNKNNFTKYDYLVTEEMNDYYNSLITEEEYNSYYQGELKDLDLYYLRLERINQAILDSFDEISLKTWVIKVNMDKPSSGQTKIIKSDVLKEEAAFLMEHTDEYPGFDVQINWNREYPYGTLLKSVLGSVTTSKQGLPEEMLDYYLALGYSRNDRVGKSGIEMEYETILSGDKAIYTVDYEEGNAVLNEINQGSKGYDVQLGIDVNLQVQTEKYISEILTKYNDDPTRVYLDRINVVVSNPKTGDILTMASMVKDDEGNVYSDPIATYTNAYPVGSVVKGATVYMGLDQEVITKNEIIIDQPFKIKATPVKSSWQNLGAVNAISALARSSNVYMYNIAVRLSGGSYVYDGPLYVKEGTFTLMRNYYSLFGLGELTGLDVPNEMIGYMGSSENPGNILDYVIGQYDNYTTIMLSQYINTVANGGYKMQPRLVTKAFESGTNNLIYENSVNILNVLDNQEAIETVREGMYACVNDAKGLCYGIDPSYKENVSGKSGTAQDYVYETNEDGVVEKIQAPNQSYISFAPYDDPEVSIACIAPKSWNGDDGQSNPCFEIANKIYGYYLYSNE